MRNNIKYVLVVLIVLFSAGYSFACGPFFDEAYMVRGSKENFLAMPEGYFESEIKRILKMYEVEAVAQDKKSVEIIDVDLKDLKQALIDYNVPRRFWSNIERNYVEARTKIRMFLQNCPKSDYIWYGDRFRNHQRAKQESWLDFGPSFKFAKGLPEEFKLYMQGAVFYHNNDFENAIKQWQKILELPRAKRKYKSVWAAFMIGKACLNQYDDLDPIKYFELTRKLANAGYKDSLNLSLDSYGWQALAEYENRDLVSSLEHYAIMGDIASLNKAINTFFYELDKQGMTDVLRNNMARDIIVSYIASNSGIWFGYYYANANEPKKTYHLFLDVIEELGLKKSIPHAERIAWIYYNRGDIDKAKRWLVYAKENSFLGKWIDAKVTLREGNMDEALRKLKGLLPYIKKSQDSIYTGDVTFYEAYQYEDGKYTAKKLNSEVGVLQLRNQDYVQAMDSFVNGEYWQDVAYIAENVFTLQELESYLRERGKDFNWPESKYTKSSSLKGKTTYYESLRYLLARRFARNDQWGKALEYMPNYLKVIWRTRKPSGKGYLMHSREYGEINPKEETRSLYRFLEKANDSARGRRDRAKNYYEAGILMRRLGMEIMGTELEPDWFLHDGQYSYTGPTGSRFGILSDEEVSRYKKWGEWGQDDINSYSERRKEVVENRDFYAGSEDEECRVINSLPEHYRRFHYRYRAADLMWKAAELLPDNDVLKSEALWHGGLYLRDSDDKAADKFYKELVKTCKNTTLGKEADRIRWFPKEDWYEEAKGRVGE